jgi:hypothetical protein
MAKFPSVKWFEAIQDVVNADDRLRKLGTCDAIMGVKVEDKAFEITFEAFDITGVREVSEADLVKTDFYLDASAKDWQVMLENIKKNGGTPDRQYTLNTIDFLSAEGFAKSDDQSKKDSFHRYGQTFQLFFNASAEVAA